MHVPLPVREKINMFMELVYKLPLKKKNSRKQNIFILLQ